MRAKNILFIEKVLLLIAIFVLSQNECLGLNIYSALPDHIVEWLKRHILIEISNINTNITHDYLENHLENVQTCNSINGPFCKYLSRISHTSELDLDTKKYIYDHEGSIGYLNKDFFMGKSIYNLLLISEIFAQDTISAFDQEVKTASRAKSDDNITIQKHCKLTKKNLIYCLKLILKSYYKTLIRKFTEINYISRFMSTSKAFLQLFKNFKLFKMINNSKKRKISRIKYEKRAQIYTIIHDYDLPPLHSDFLDQEGNYLEKSKISEDYNEPKYISQFHSKNMHFQTKSNLLFDETLNSFLKSRYVRFNLINSLTWILQQKSPYSDIWQNWRNERLGKHYIIIDHPESHRCNQFSVSPYNGVNICSDLLIGDFHSKFRVIRKSWNGVSSIMNFSSLKPNVRLLPSKFSNDEKLSFVWEGLWETYQDKVLNIKLLSRFGKLMLINEKFVISRLPISISSGFLELQTNRKTDEPETITISGYNYSKLMWKSTIPISNFISENSNKMKWLNALDYSDNIPYSLINIIQFETDFRMDYIEEGIIVGPFEYNLLNPIFNYIPRNDIYENLNVEISQLAELSLVTYINNNEQKRNNTISSISMTTMYVSKASPLVSIYNIENNRLYLKDKISENTLCVIKRNMAELTKDQ
ncbi:uncharacterized protein cubi_02531 [Cryptosporidium ubiquitum]|uniref:Uncharacterized protein n=1 Tax=Cryptosporidium ubiquitum TaxID=857276 RepID=A0A1J4MH37_9CRYT|nr:uncharacterized protein cubi_02531 [Cryptosporidium ubiquitum]OII73319.1 hypothetical protein cubi_02531 [Cryptosporidium ubiquitum]